MLLWTVLWERTESISRAPVIHFISSQLLHTVCMSVVASHLKTPHVSRVPGILQAVLVALQEELEEEPVHAEREAGKGRDELEYSCLSLKVSYDLL